MCLRGLETDFEEGLPLTRRVALASAATTASIGTHEPEIARSVRKVGVRTANLHPIEDVEEFHSEFCINTLTEEKLLGQSEIFISVERVAQLA